MRWLFPVLEIAFVVVLTLAPRCANWSDVFADDGIYFTDGDCYARMSRARLIWEHRALIVRDHDFKNHPAGTIPHTTAPIDYCIIGAALVLKPFVSNALEVAGAIVSPLLGIATAIVLWGWMRHEIRFVRLRLSCLRPARSSCTRQNSDGLITSLCSSFSSRQQCALTK